MRTAIISHSDCAKHEMGFGHPENPARLQAIAAQLEKEQLTARLSYYEAPLATREQLERAHHHAYVDTLFSLAPSSGYRSIDGDTTMNSYTLNAALRAAGAVVNAVDKAMSREADALFCNVRPPGHHAEHARAMGFCFFNNVAVGVAHALAVYKLTRVAIVDFDVHHGNGTEDIFRDDDRVMLCSSFQHPHYPYCGADTVSNHILNVPLVAGADGRAFRQAAQKVWLARIDDFKPQMVFFSAGFDAHRDDPLASLNFVEDDYAWITTAVCEIAKRYNAPVISSLEGGYALGALGHSATAHIRAMIETE